MISTTPAPTYEIPPSMSPFCSFWPRIVFSQAATLMPVPSASPIRLPTTESDFSMPMPGPYATISISTFDAPRSACRLRALLSARFHLTGSLSLTCMMTRLAGAAAVWPNAGDAMSITAVSSVASHVSASASAVRGDAIRILRPVSLRAPCARDAYYAFGGVAGAFGDNRGDAPCPCADPGDTARRGVGVLLHAARHDHEVRNAALPAAGADLRALRSPDDRNARLARSEHALRPVAHPEAAAADRPRADRAVVVGVLRRRAEGAAACRGDGAQLLDADD